MTYGCQTLSKALVKKLETSQRATERRMLNVKLKDRIRNITIRQRTKVTDIVQYVTNTKWKWAGHIARIKDNRWTIRSTEWQREGVRSVGRPKRRWRDDIVGQQGAIWTRIAKDRVVVVCWLLNVPATGQCISGTDLLRQLYVLPYWDRSCRSNVLPHPVIVYWHRADQSQCWPYNVSRLAG